MRFCEKIWILLQGFLFYIHIKELRNLVHDNQVRFFVFFSWIAGMIACEIVVEWLIVHLGCYCQKFVNLFVKGRLRFEFFWFLLSFLTKWVSFVLSGKIVVRMIVSLYLIILFIFGACYMVLFDFRMIVGGKVMKIFGWVGWCFGRSFKGLDLIGGLFDMGVGRKLWLCPEKRGFWAHCSVWWFGQLDFASVMLGFEVTTSSLLFFDVGWMRKNSRYGGCNF